MTSLAASHWLRQRPVVVWRDQLITRYRSLAADEAVALQGMAVQGWGFAELCGELAHLGEQAPVQAVSWLRQWLADGLLQRADHLSR